MWVSLGNLLIIVGALVAAFVIILVMVRVARWRRDRALRDHGAPVLVMPVTGTPTPPRPLLPREPIALRSSPSTVRRVTPVEEPILEQVIEEDVILIDNEPFTTRATAPMQSAVDLEDIDGDAAQRQVVRGGHVRSYRAEEGTLEFLPGRLEIVAGGEIGQEIHFLREVGEDDATITFGRSDGPPLRHVQLLDPTVSRQHARLDFTEGRWHLSNLSQTNPVTLNGSAVAVSGRPLTLAEGDRVEMGAVVFIFHDR
jgi:hypothetical protein